MLEKVFYPNIAPSPGSGNHPFYKTEHMPPGNSGARYRHLVPQENLASDVTLKRAIKMQFSNALFRSLVDSGQKLWTKPDSGNFALCTLSCNI